ncbi:hypothetical protein [Pallidibacillus thermolactis]|jgi:hypothetical protein|uniref:hypothetical protein n=1 Tax=Pallidibacillus thermolactis TaxID=251051 RepID=UPI0021D85CEA|nr:hypothetical protein [Pallidibacillus thermolactis]MCU9601727.1 hypothetical protein [Pallidibacillus thermolactis subsp. kokeshiiformis]
MSSKDTRKNIKVYDKVYFDLVALSELKNMTRNDLLEWLLENAINNLDKKEKLIFKHLRDNAMQKNKN